MGTKIRTQTFSRVFNKEFRKLKLRPHGTARKGSGLLTLLLYLPRRLAQSRATALQAFFLNLDKLTYEKKIGGVLKDEVVTLPLSYFIGEILAKISDISTECESEPDPALVRDGGCKLISYEKLTSLYNCRVFIQTFQATDGKVDTWSKANKQYNFDFQMTQTKNTELFKDMNVDGKTLVRSFQLQIEDGSWSDKKILD